jgi:hypothetical protein
VAIYGFRGLIWFGCGVAVALGSYMVTSQGALEHSRLAKVEANIAQAQKDIRSLETEFNARANMLQLERWNGASLQLSAAAPQQYLASETALADINNAAPQMANANLVVPTGAAQPVPQPAVVSKTPAGTAQIDGLGKVRREAVAMIDDRLIADLRKGAQAEQLALR